MSEFPLIWLPKALRAEGLTVRVVKGWQTRGREGTFQPKKVMFHHTASSPSGGNVPALGICTNGRVDLPGPLCNVLVGRDGTCYVVAAGRCNHAGAGGPFQEIPRDSGNAYMMGVEVENNGIGEVWSQDLLQTVARVFAAFLRHEHKTARDEVGHKEWAPLRKIDPRPVDMNAHRKRTAKLLRTVVVPWPGVELHRGMRHELVRRFFKQLRHKMPMTPFAVSEFFGLFKERALKKFQKRKHLKPDGIVDADTWKAAFS